MGYSIYDLWDDADKGELDSFVKSLKECARNDKPADLINHLIREIAESEGKTYIEMVHDLILHQEDKEVFLVVHGFRDVLTYGALPVGTKIIIEGVKED